jgi:hypothetical protein
MSLMLVILVTILSGVIDLGRGFFSYIAIQNAAGEGALYAAINPALPACRLRPAGFDCSNPNNVVTARKMKPVRRPGRSAQMSVQVFYADGTSGYSADNTLEGNPIELKVQYRFGSSAV